MDIRNIINTVQHNCHISDARHAGNYTLCVYLLKMREFYRWERQHTFNEKLSTENIGNWLNKREALWDEIENEDYQTLQLNNSVHDPFDSAAINQQLLAENLVYSGGYGVKEKPHFFLADLEKKESINGYSIYISGKEYARDLTSPPAAKAIRCYDFDNDLENALNSMTDNELDAAVLHEIGEIQAGEYLPSWHQMMNDITFTQAEIMARAVRDHYADTLHTLPTLIENNNHASIHFYFANLTNMRKHIFPSLMNAYNKWCDDKNINIIEKTVTTSLDHWKNISKQILALHQQHTTKCSVKIETLVNDNHI